MFNKKPNLDWGSDVLIKSYEFHIIFHVPLRKYFFLIYIYD